MITITPLQRTLVQRSFRKIAGKTDSVANLLYKRLFEIDPSCKMLFACDMHLQGRKLVGMLAVAVSGLNTPETLIPEIRALGARHAGYGAKPEDYRFLGESLLYALEHTLGDEFTPETREAWTTFYTFIAELATPTAAH